MSCTNTISAHAIILPISIKPEHAKDWEEFTINEGLPGVEKEPDTKFWSGTKTEGGGSQYSITDLFPHEEGRNSHLQGAVAAAVFSKAGTLT